jgi:hypothetical protein
MTLPSVYNLANGFIRCPKPECEYDGLIQGVPNFWARFHKDWKNKMWYFYECEDCGWKSRRSHSFDKVAEWVENAKRV